MSSGQARAVDAASIEQSLTELWRSQGEGESITRAALWNVVAHTTRPEDRAQVSATLADVSGTVPQRSIVIESRGEGEGLDSWVNAACHLTGGGRQVCSEQIAIVASGERVHHVPSLVQALLLPDMPVAAWWVGRLPPRTSAYVAELLEPADRLIVDGRWFEGEQDLKLLASLSRETSSPPVDLVWLRLEAWRSAIAAAFDAPGMRERLSSIRKIRLITDSESSSLSENLEAVYTAAWLRRTAGRADVELDLESRPAGLEKSSLICAEIFSDGPVVTVQRRADGFLSTEVSGGGMAAGAVTRLRSRSIRELLVRQLSGSTGGDVFADVLPHAAEVAAQTS